MAIECQVYAQFQCGIVQDGTVFGKAFGYFSLLRCVSLDTWSCFYLTIGVKLTMNEWYKAISNVENYLEGIFNNKKTNTIRFFFVKMQICYSSLTIFNEDFYNKYMFL